MAATNEDELRDRIDLKVLSPNLESTGGLNLRDLPVSTTIADLRVKLHNELPGNPSPERLRLIYLGRLIRRDSDTLLDVFGREAVCLSFAG